MIERMKQHRFTLMAMLTLLFLLLSACGNSDADSASKNGSANASDSTSTQSETAAEADEPATYKYTDALGREVEIPTHPGRIITTQYLPELIAVGVKPVGAASHLLTGFAAIKDQLGGIEDIGVANDPNVEKMLTLKPDLIIATEFNKDILDKLSKIAPTIVIQWGEKTAFEHFNEVAASVGLKDKADAWTEAYNKKAEETRGKLASIVKPEETFGVVVIGGYEPKQLRVYGNSNVGYTLYDALKLPMTDVIKAEMAKGNTEQGVSISLEKLPEYASADRLFLVTFDNDPDFVTEVNGSALWKNLPAVKNGKVYAVNSDLWFGYDVMSFDAQLDDVVGLLTR